MFGLISAEVFRPFTEEKEASFREPTDGSLRYSPYGAMPAHPFKNESIKARQRHIFQEFMKLFKNYPADVPAEFAEMLEDDYFIGEQRRGMQNYEGYTEWLGLKQALPAEFDGIVEQYENGGAFPDEILTLAISAKLPSFELGKVTSPYRKRLEHVAPMREDVRDAIEFHGGVVYPSIQPYRSIDIQPMFSLDTAGMHRLVGCIVKYKRDFGHIDIPAESDRLSIVERQIAGYRIDESSGFPQELVARLEAIVAERYANNPEAVILDWSECVKESGLAAFIEAAVQSDSLEPFVVPESTTLYGFRQPIPGVRRDFERIKDLGGIAYIGPQN